MARPTVVANTDRAWFDHFRPADTLARIDEVNFWRPQAQNRFRALAVGEPLFFRLKHPVNAIAGFGFFALETFLTVQIAWEVFREKNGDPSYERFSRRVTDYQQGNTAHLLADGQRRLSCLILRDAVFLPTNEWLQWGDGMEWARNIVSYKAYDLDHGVGAYLSPLLSHRNAEVVPDLVPQFEPLTIDARTVAMQPMIERVGQGTFRARLLVAYDGRCAVTGEHTLPVLDAAHIQPYLGPASNHVQNGLVLRTDLHRLYDLGYLTVTPDSRFTVSARLREDFANGKIYYGMDGQAIALPADPALRPSRAALEWHARNIFR